MSCSREPAPETSRGAGFQSFRLRSVTDPRSPLHETLTSDNVPHLAHNTTMGGSMRTRAITALAAAGLLALTACSNNDNANRTATSADRPSTATTTSAPATKALDAEQVVKALTEAIPSAKAATVYTAATDRNHLLGRPGGYTAKADWTDQRAKPDLDDEVQLGGSVEVFTDAADAKKRDEYIAGILKAAPVLGTEYHYVKGGILLRVSGALTPEQAAEYEAALNEIS